MRSTAAAGTHAAGPPWPWWSPCRRCPCARRHAARPSLPATLTLRNCSFKAVVGEDRNLLLMPCWREDDPTDDMVGPRHSEAAQGWIGPAVPLPAGPAQMAAVWLAAGAPAAVPTCLLAAYADSDLVTAFPHQCPLYIASARLGHAPATWCPPTPQLNLTRPNPSPRPHPPTTPRQTRTHTSPPHPRTCRCDTS